MALGTKDGLLQVPENDWEIQRDCRAFFLAQAARLLREAEPLPDEAVDSFLRALGNYFDQKVVIGRGTSFEQTAGLTASRITLVAETDLELEIRTGDFASQLMQGASAELWRVYLRFVTLLGRRDLSPKDNPVGPRGFANGLVALSAMLGEDHDRALDRVERMQDYFAEFLPGLYVAINDFLLGRNVSAAQPTLITAPDVGQALPGGRTGALALDPAAALERHLAGPTPVAGTAASLEAGIASSLLTQAMLSRLLVRLDDIERAAAAGGEDHAAPGKRLDARQLGIPEHAPEAAAIDTLAMIFESVFASPDLPDPIKAALASLQIPLLRAAMLEPGFFSADAHPARLLFDKMARAALGLPEDVSTHHPLCERIRSMAKQVRAEFSRDTQILVPHLVELDALIGERDAAADAAALICLPLLQRHEQLQLAERAAELAVEEICRRPDLPAPIATFLRTHWQRLLRDTWLVSGESSQAWQDARAAMHGLLWSVQPKTDPEERKRLARDLPSLLQRVTSGMQRLGIDDAGRAEFLDTCFALQTAAMRGIATTPAPTATIPQAPARPPGAEPVIDEISGDGIRLRVVTLPEPRRAFPRARQSSVHVGEWLSFGLGDERLCGRVAQTGKEGGKLLLASPEWPFAVALDTGFVEARLKDGSASVASRQSLFNVAAEQALRRSAGQARQA